MVKKSRDLQIFLASFGLCLSFFVGSTSASAAVCAGGGCGMDVCSVKSSEASPVREASRCRPGVCPLSSKDIKTLNAGIADEAESVSLVDEDATPVPQSLELLRSENTVTNPGPGFDITYIGPPGGMPTMVNTNGPWGLGF